jgi:hypothetical protein
MPKRPTHSTRPEHGSLVPADMGQEGLMIMSYVRMCRDSLAAGMIGPNGDGARLLHSSFMT